MEKLEGVVEHIVYTNPENGYTVCLLDCGNGEPVTAVGLLPSTVEGERLIAKGAWTNHPSFGRQFRIESYEKQLPDGAEGMYKFLSSGYIKGLGPINAMRLVEKYGEESFDVLANHPEWLAEFKGISQRVRQI